MNKYVQSGYARAVDDHYPTVDPRCASALFENWDVPLPALDPFCSHLETGLHPATIGHLDSADQFKAIVTNQCVCFFALIGMSAGRRHRSTVING